MTLFLILLYLIILALLIYDVFIEINVIIYSRWKLLTMFIIFFLHEKLLLVYNSTNLFIY